MSKKKFTTILTNSIERASPASVWGRGVPGKGGCTTNSTIIEKKTENIIDKGE